MMNDKEEQKMNMHKSIYKQEIVVSSTTAQPFQVSLALESFSNINASPKALP